MYHVYYIYAICMFDGMDLNMEKHFFDTVTETHLLLSFS